MPLIAAGTLKTTLWVDLAIMGASLLASVGWYAFNQRASLKSTLLYSIFALAPRALLPLFLLFNFSYFARADSFNIYWIRWVCYAFAWGFGGLLHALIHVGRHPQYYWRWAASVPLLVAYAMMAIGAKQPDQDQRLVLLIISAISLTSAAVVVMLINRTGKLRINLLLVAEAILLLAGFVFYCLGHSMYRTLAIEWETVAYLIIDFLAFPVGLFFVNILHCPCPNGGDRYESVPLADARCQPQSSTFATIIA